MATALVPVKRITALSVTLALLFVTIAFLAVPRAEATYPGGNGLIVFESGFSLYVMASDGSSAPVKITTDADPFTDPAFSPDGTKIAYSRAVAGAAAIYVSPFDPSSPTLTSAVKVTNGTTDGSPTWSPDGSNLAFVRETTSAIDTTGQTATAADLAGLKLTDATPPGGSFITAGVLPGHLVTNTRTGAFGRVASLTATEITLKSALTNGSPDNEWKDGDGYTIAPSHLQIWSASAAGTNQTGTLLSAIPTVSVYDDASPEWSPVSFASGSELITFASNREAGGNFDIFVMKPEPESGTNSPTNLTSSVTIDNNAEHPTWAPDGSQIAFDAREPDIAPYDSNIWLVPVSVAVDGTVTPGELDDITSGETGDDDDALPAWSPDGEKIAFLRGGTGADKTFTITPEGDGAAVVRADAAPATHIGADWRPTLLGVNDGPYAADEGTTLVVSPASGVLANDSFLVASAGSKSAVKDTDPQHGTVTLNADGSFTYVHNGTETPATDSFTYHPVQGALAGTVATVAITIAPVNDAPVAEDDGPYNVEHSGTLIKAAPGVLVNDTDADDTVLTAEKVADPASGTVTLNPDGSFTYVHGGDAAKTDSFTYKAKDDGGAYSNVATVRITIGDEPPPPVKKHSTGLVDPGSGQWYLYDDAGTLTTSFYYGNPGDYPFMGDWDGDGVETPGLYRQSDGYVYLRNSNTVGVADIKFFFGNPGDVPIAGDFNNDGFDTVSIYRPSNQTFYIINKLGSGDQGLGAADFSYVFGNPGDKPFVGDFDGDGIETVGLHRESTGLVYFRNSHTQGNADAQFIFGDPGDRLIAGDWTDDGVFTPALFRPSNTTMYFRYTNTQGNADNQFIPTPTNPAWLPVSGKMN